MYGMPVGRKSNEERRNKLMWIGEGQKLLFLYKIAQGGFMKELISDNTGWRQSVMKACYLKWQPSIPNSSSEI